MKTQKKTVKQRLRELKEWVKTSPDILLVSVDPGKFRDCACFMISNGKVLRKKYYFKNRRMDFKQLRLQAKHYQNKFGLQGILLGLEPSGDYWKHLYHYWINCNLPVVVVNPLAVCRNRETIDVSKDKSDPKDAYNIGDLVRQGKFYFPVKRDGQTANISRFMRIRFNLVGEKTRIRNRLRNAVGYVFPELEGYFKDITGKVITSILAHYPLPGQIKSLSKNEFRDFIKRVHPRFSNKRTEEIYALAQDSVGITIGSEAASFEIQLLLNQLRRVEDDLASVESRVDTLVKERLDYTILRSIEGIGPITAASLIGEIGDINNFSSGKQLVKLAGLDLYAAESGVSIHTRKRITKRGRKVLRTVIYLAAVQCIRHNPYLRAFYMDVLNNQSSKKKVKNKAVIALACKLLRMIYRMLKESKSFDQSYDQRLKVSFYKKAA